MNYCRWTLFVPLALGPWSLANFGSASDVDVSKLPPAADREVDFVADIRPLLENSCFDCHSGDTQEGGLRLDHNKKAMQGGDSGPVIVPGDSAGSRLIHLVSGLDEEIGTMPPEDSGDRLSAEQIGLLRAWIDQGANWPDDASVAEESAEIEHWSFQPIVRPPVPEVKDAGWVANPIDAFILSKLEKENVNPSPEADRATLLRRLTLDLVGLLPELEELEAFLADEDPGAYQRQVNRLLASPHYGERWGRYWLDAARYADSDGYEKDLPRPHAWRYRDWVINALNSDMPFDVFTVQQLAGDLLTPEDPEYDPLARVATGFHRNTLVNKEGGVDPEEDRVKRTVDRTNTMGTVWLGLTVGCANCHTHKYDPITQREYFQLYAFFNNLDESDTAVQKGLVAQVVSEVKNPRETFVHLRGDFLSPGPKVEPGTPEVLPPLAARNGHADRLDVARWLVSGDNPLTARVIANRIWQGHFGRGLVSTDDDFGTQGESPSHPELLDWLASEFRDSGWSVKHLHRLIVTSATYRQSSAARPELRDRDPYNRWLARQNRIRLEAEIIRDLALCASGLLHRKIGGPSIRPPQPPGVADLTYANSARWHESKGPDRYRRGLYIWFQRTSPYPSLMVFDAPESNLTCTRRERSNTPLQSLTLLNDVVFVECARALGKQLSQPLNADHSPSAETIDAMVRQVVRACLSRDPTDREHAMLLDLYRLARSQYRRNAEACRAALAEETISDTEAAARSAACAAVARAVLNLDEFITRE